MKDFFDIWWVSRQFEFDGATLAEAIKKTFANRGREIVPEPLPLTAAFGEDQDRKVQWRTFRRKSRLEFAPEGLQEVTTVVATFPGRWWQLSRRTNPSEVYGRHRDPGPKPREKRQRGGPWRATPQRDCTSPPGIYAH